MPRWTGVRGASVAAGVFWLVATSFRPWRLFERGPYTADFYDVQGRALGRGGLAVPADVAGIEGFRIGDETHLYFGLVPAIARIPLVVWDDWLDGRLAIVSMALAVLVGGLATARLAVRAMSLGGPDAPDVPWLADGAAAVFGLATPVLWLASRQLVYHEAELWGAALALLGCERALAWWEERTPRSLAVAGTIALLALHTRASSGLAPMLFLLALAGVVLVRERSWRLAAGPVAVAVVAVGTYAAVNAARFGSPFSIPFDRQVFTALSPSRQAMLEETDGSFFSPRFVPTTLTHLLRPDAVRPDSLYPFVSWGPRASVIGDAPFDTVERSGSIITTMPVLVFAALGLRPRRIPLVWWAMVAACAAAAIPTLAIGFIAHRYLVDLVPLMIVLAVLGLPRVLAWRRSRAVLGAFAALGCVVALGLGSLAHNVYLLPAPGDTAAFLRMRYALHDVYGSAPPPDLERRTELGDPPAEGTTVLVGDCDGVFVSSGDGWLRTEVRTGGAFAATLLGRAGDGPAATGPGWELTLRLVGDEFVLEYASAAGITSSDPLDVEPGADIRLDVLTGGDPIGIEVRVDGGDEPALVAFESPEPGPAVPAIGWDGVEGDAPLCADLLERFDG